MKKENFYQTIAIFAIIVGLGVIYGLPFYFWGGRGFAGSLLTTAIVFNFWGFWRNER